MISVLGLGLSSLVLAGCSLNDLQQLKAKAGLQVITSENQAASLFLNGEYLDKTPYINKNIKPGVYSLKIDPTDKTLAPFETQITLANGALAVVTWSPGKTPETSGGVIYELLNEKTANSSKAEISFVTIPENAIITVDNKPQTFSPLTLTDVEPGNHELEVKLPSYVTQRHTLNAAAGRKLQITVKLAKQNASAPSPTPGPTASQSAQTVNPMSIASSSAITQASLSAKLAPKTSTQSATIGSKVMILKTGFFQAGKEVLRVRAAADPNSATVGYADVNQKYPYLNAHENGWLKLTLSSTITGWVSDQYAELSE